MAKSKLDFIHEAEDTLEGFEDINSSTKAIPFLKLAQDLTPQTKKNKPEYIEGLEVGQFFNSVTGDVYGTEIDVIIAKFEHMYIEWKPDRGGFVQYLTPEVAEKEATDKSVFGKWKTASGNELREYYAYYTIIAGREEEGILIMSLTSTAIKTAKMLNKMMTTHLMDDVDKNGKPTQVKAKPFYLVYTLNSALQTKGANDFYGYRFTFKDFINEKQYAVVGTERVALPDKTVNYAALEDHSAQVVGEDDF